MTALAATAADMPAVARRDVEERVCDLLAHIYDIGVHLADARAFTAANSTDAIAKEKAEVELALVGASAAEIRPLKATMTRLDGRRSLAQRVEADARTLAVRLQSAGSELEDLHARLSATAEPDALLHELRAYERSARLALEAFATTEAEMDRLTRSD